ncbi:MAG: DUF362 domain-containing protein [Prevotella sp.]|nr:DUF362 domain-containing protein [Prevotella sp.]
MDWNNHKRIAGGIQGRCRHSCQQCGHRDGCRQQPERCTDERNTSENHWKVIERHGFTKYFPVDIMDEYDEIRIPVKDQTHIKYDIVGGHMANYDFMIALNHFKGHPMGGYGGALKNLSIGCASQNGKAYIG